MWRTEALTHGCLSDPQGQTLLMFAMQGGNLDCVQLALSLDGDPDEKTDNVGGDVADRGSHSRLLI